MRWVWCGGPLTHPEKTLSPGRQRKGKFCPSGVARMLSMYALEEETHKGRTSIPEIEFGPHTRNRVEPPRNTGGTRTPDVPPGDPTQIERANARGGQRRRRRRQSACPGPNLFMSSLCVRVLHYTTECNAQYEPPLSLGW